MNVSLYVGIPHGWAIHNQITGKSAVRTQIMADGSLRILPVKGPALDHPVEEASQ